MSCGLLISMFAAIGTNWMETERLDAFVRQLAQDQARHFVSSLDDQRDHRGAEETLDGFVFAHVKLPNGSTAVKFEHAGLPVPLREKLQRLHQNADNEHLDFTLDGHSYMFLAFTVKETGIQFSGLYRVGDELSSHLSHQVFWSVIGVIGVVLSTTLILIPIIGRLERQVLRHAHDAIDANIDALATLGSAIAKRDSDTDAHNYRVTLYAIRLAEKIGLEHDAMRNLIRGAFLHDVGKIAIPDAILLKQGRLSVDEFSIMKTHVQHGVDIVRDSRWLKAAVKVIACHHEKYDGNGYPSGLAGEKIPVLARIFSIVDVFDALTSRRPYKEALPLKDALDLMRAESGRHFDPVILGNFMPIAGDLHAMLNSAEEESTARQALHRELRRYFLRPDL
jgi:putative nucleotidyltransferase with HDIG domain